MKELDQRIFKFFFSFVVQRFCDKGMKNGFSMLVERKEVWLLFLLWEILLFTMVFGFSYQVYFILVIIYNQFFFMEWINNFRVVESIKRFNKKFLGLGLLLNRIYFIYFDMIL